MSCPECVPLPTTGPQGPPGTAGTSGGNNFLVGVGAPSPSLGNIGDLYIDKSTGFLYGPKTNAGWGSPFTLVPSIVITTIYKAFTETSNYSMLSNSTIYPQIVTYIINSSGLVTGTLPTTLCIGDQIIVTGLGSGGWKIAQNASQIINFGNLSTTSGTSGFISSLNQFDCVTLGYVANNTFNVLSATGNLTIN